MTKIIKNIKNRIRKIQTFDWMLIAISILIISVFGYIFLRRTTEITVTIETGQDEVFYSSWITSWENWKDLSGTKNWFANLFYEGLKEKDGLGKTKAEVLNVFSYSKTATKKDVYLTVRLKAVYNKASNTYSYKGVPILVGSTLKLNFDKVFVNGLITEIEGFPKQRPREKIIVEARIIEENSIFLETTGTEAYVAEALEKGEEIKDNKDNTLIKVISKRAEPAKKIVTTSNGDVVIRYDPLRKDVYLVLEVNAFKYGNEYFLLNDIPILVDQTIPINTSKISIFPTVTKIIFPDRNE